MAIEGSRRPETSGSTQNSGIGVTRNEGRSGIRSSTKDSGSSPQSKPTKKVGGTFGDALFSIPDGLALAKPALKEARKRLGRVLTDEEIRDIKSKAIDASYKSKVAARQAALDAGRGIGKVK